ncbi:transcription factor kayak isoform X2 [Vespula squamosa]|uniref:Transcription factor kayak isoform X2 n=1 Tax=Vespula squamosa TaxID=30214 RepID=A0ABD2BY71_VESSQ
MAIKLGPWLYRQKLAQGRLPLVCLFEFHHGCEAGKRLDVSDVLYDSSSVSSDSGTSQSSRVSHDFLSSIANSATLPGNEGSIK